MNGMVSNFKFIFFLLLACCLGCVSAKKHNRLTDALRAEYQSEMDKCNSEIETLTNKNETLNLRLAERQGEINILMALRQELADTIAQLEQTLVNMGSQSASAQQNLNTELFQKQNIIKLLNAKLQRIDDLLDRHNEKIETMADELSGSVEGVNEKNVLVVNNHDQVKVVLSEAFLFRNKSTTRLEKDALEALENLSKVINRYPEMQVMVVGHTDNSAPNSAFKNNWNFSALQSATVVTTLTSEFGLSHNQVTVAGKGEFNPRASNSTSEGRAANRRIELLIAPNPEDLVKAIQGEL